MLALRPMGLALAVVLAGCGGRSAAVPEAGSLEALAAELDAAGGLVAPREKAAFADILADALSKDPYLCRPSAREVFSGHAPEGSRTIAGVMPHYGFFDGPMHYEVRRSRGRWEVGATIAVALPPEGGRLELPDCGLALDLLLEDRRQDLASIGAVCEGTAYSNVDSLEACPASGTFSLPATRRTMRALLARWSRLAAEYYNVDARSFEIPVVYTFSFIPAPEADPARVDLAVPLATTCGRTPYFSSFRSGWSLPIVAHEVGHILGLLDEYEALSGITRAYPKTPFPGAERSRMALSMREASRVLPIHHYLVLRRYLCPAPTGSFFRSAPL